MQGTRDDVAGAVLRNGEWAASEQGRGAPGASFWRERLVELGLIVALACYYLVGNRHIPLPGIDHVPALLSLPFLLIFALLAWYRLSVAVALLPLSLPYYLLQKNIVSHYDFSLVEIMLWTCLGVAALQLLVQRRNWPYWLTWAQLRERVGPFALPILLFAAAAAFSIVIAYAHATALRAFREEVLGPLLYLLLALACLRTRQDITRLLGALIGTALIIAVFGLIQYFFFKNTLVLESDGIRRVHTVYGSANSIGLLFDYALPVALAWLLATGTRAYAQTQRLLALLACIPLVVVLYLTQSRGAWIAIAVATLFIVAASLAPHVSRRTLLLLGGVVLLVLLVGVVVFHNRLIYLFIESHTNGQVNTVTKRLYLWETALRMIQARPWFGFGMDNWLCYYSLNNICNAHQFHYWIVSYPPNTGIDTGLREEPTLSHPHNILLQIWVSMGIFGLLAFIAIVALFARHVLRLLARLRTDVVEGNAQLRWMTIGVGGAMLAALVQGMGDSSFLEQDLAFCFWILVLALLLLRIASGTAWRGGQAT
jgi:putative inorganic carbon (HCO3(-)) transporter